MRRLPHIPGKCCRRARPSGFTAVELLMALSISSIVMLALSAIMTSVARGWSYTENAQGHVMAETAGMLRIENLLRPGKLTGAVSAGSIDGTESDPASLILWAADKQGNGMIEIAEIAILEHDPVSKTVQVWEIPGATSWDTQSIPRSMLDDPANVATFKQIAEVRARPLAMNVAAMALWVHSPAGDGEMPSVEYALTFERPLRRGTGAAPRVMRYGSATLRALAASPPDP